MAIKDEYFTISEAARALGVTRQTVSRWIKKGRIDSESVGREILIKKNDLFQYQYDDLIGAAAHQIVVIMKRYITDYCQNKKYITATEQVVEAGMKEDAGTLVIKGLDESTRTIKIKAEETQEISKKMQPIIANYLRDFSDVLKKKAEETIGMKMTKKEKAEK
jgi:excisionase family DNA binding protein